MIIGIALVARNGVIGNAGNQPVFIPEDLARFKNLTTGKTVIMGRKTFDTIGKVLPDRTTIVVTTRPEGVAPHPRVRVATSVHDAIAKSFALGDITFVAGGGSVYRQAFQYMTDLYLTELHYDVEGDIYFPSLGSEWKEVSREERVGYDFVNYTKFEDRPDGIYERTSKYGSSTLVYVKDRRWSTYDWGFDAGFHWPTTEEHGTFTLIDRREVGSSARPISDYVRNPQ